MTSTAWDEEGWRVRVKYMRDTMMAGEGPRLSDEKLEDFVSYLTTAFGPNSPKPKSPEELAQYQSLVRPFSPAAMNIAYVEYDFGGESGLGPCERRRGPGRDALDSVLTGAAIEVVRLNPKTAELSRFPLPFSRTAGIPFGHSRPPTAPSGSRKPRSVGSGS